MPTAAPVIVTVWPVEKPWFAEVTCAVLDAPKIVLLVVMLIVFASTMVAVCSVAVYHCPRSALNR